MTDEIAFLSATRLVALYREKKLSPVEVLAETLRRLERYEGALNAFVLYDPEAAMAQARASEARWRTGRAAGPARRRAGGDQGHGADPRLAAPRRLEARSTRTRQWNEDSPVTARLRAHGAVLFGKTTTPEFGWKPLTDSPLSGVTRNPWNLERTPGGSSGGSAAAVLGRHLPAGGRHRRRRLDPHPGFVLRHLRVEADLWPGRGLSALGLWRRCPCRADGAHRRRRRADARRDQGAGFARLAQPARRRHRLSRARARKARSRASAWRCRRLWAWPSRSRRCAPPSSAPPRCSRGLGAAVELADPFPQSPRGIFEPLALAAFWALAARACRRRRPRSWTPASSRCAGAARR